MAENLPLSVQLDDNPNGTVTFASEVVATMAGLATTEVEGVFSMYAGSAGFGDIFGRRNQSNKNTRGVRVDVVDNKIAVDISIVVDYGTPVPQIAREIQENVKKTVENMTGLEVSNVDVHVQGISFEKENKAQAELLEQQKAAAAALLAKAEPEAEEAPAEETEAEEVTEAEAEPEAEAEAEETVETEAEEAAEEEDDDEFELILEDVPEEEEEPEVTEETEVSEEEKPETVEEPVTEE